MNFSSSFNYCSFSSEAMLLLSNENINKKVHVLLQIFPTDVRHVEIMLQKYILHKKGKKCCKKHAALSNQFDNAAQILQHFFAVKCCKNCVCCDVLWLGHEQHFLSNCNAAFFCCVWMENVARGP